MDMAEILHRKCLKTNYNPDKQYSFICQFVGMC